MKPAFVPPPRIAKYSSELRIAAITSSSVAPPASIARNVASSVGVAARCRNVLKKPWTSSVRYSTLCSTSSAACVRDRPATKRGWNASSEAWSISRCSTALKTSSSQSCSGE